MFAKLNKLEYKWLVAIVFVIGMFMDILDTTIVNRGFAALGQSTGSWRIHSMGGHWIHAELGDLDSSLGLDRR